MKKLLIVGLATLVLGGCNITQNWQQQAAQDENTREEVVTTESKVQDPELANTPAVSEGTDEAALEKDLNETEIMDEDFSDLEI